MKPQDVVDFVQATTAAINTAATRLDRHEKQAAARQELIPAVVEALLSSGAIEPEEKQAAFDVLRDPLQTLHLLKNVAEARSTAPALGQPAPAQKQASSRRGQIRDRDRRLFEHFGIEPPATEL